jgi:hypothetical protein
MIPYVASYPNLAPTAPPPISPTIVDPDAALPYEYDEYYNTRVARPWAKLSLPKVLGIFMIILGCLNIIWSAILIARSAVMVPYFNNPNYNKVIRTNGANPNLAGVWQENSIWPTFGSGMWIGLLVRI